MIEHSRDHPKQKLAHLQAGLWKILFGSVWDHQISILRGKSNVVEKYERAQLLGELVEWRRQCSHRLGTNQQYLIGYTMDEAKK